MENVGLFPFRFVSEIHPQETCIAVTTVVVARFRASQRGDCIDAYREQVVRIALEEFEDVRMGFADLGQIIRVTDLGEFRAFLRNGESG